MALNSDQENSFVALKKAISIRRQAATVCIESPLRESQTNAAVKKAIRSRRGQFRVLKGQLEEHLRQKIAMARVVTGWMVVWAAELISQ